MTPLYMTAAAFVLIRGLFFAINSMTHATHIGIRVAWIALTLGAAAILLLGSKAPQWPEVLFAWSVVALVFFDRRTQILCERKS